jgi:hypothetical protein
MADLEKQPHGGALRRYQPGEPGARLSANKGTSIKATRRQCRDLMAEASIENTRRLLELCCSEDQRVAIIAIKEANDRLWGRVSDTGLQHEPGESGLDLTKLTEDERAELAGAVATIRRITRMAADRAEGIVEG